MQSTFLTIIENLKWKPEYETGIETLDKQHRELLFITSNTLKKLYAKQEKLEENFCLELGILLGFIKGHFSIEDAIIHENKFSKKIIDGHMDEHRRTLKLIDDFCSDIASHRSYANKTTLFAIANMVCHHIEAEAQLFHQDI
jgi:hemerythrin-like metal-binding protein